MIYNKETAELRSKLTQKIRDFFNKNDFIEVETPIMTPIPGMEPHLTPFETKFTPPDGKIQTLYLNTSPELQMKKLLGAGFKNIYNLTKVFRNGEVGGGRHNPEFTMLEWYRTKANYLDLMKDCENLVIHLSGKKIIKYDHREINLEKPWDKKSIHELFMQYCRIDLLKNKDLKTFSKTAKTRGTNISGCKDWDDIFFKIFLNEIEPFLGMKKPIFVYDYPVSQAALAKRKDKESFWAERFELYIGGNEIANAYSELLDSGEQKERLLEEQKLRKKLGKTAFDIDEEFLTSLESIPTSAAGIALGIDRLFMVLLNKNHIEDVLLFPLTNLLKI